MVFTRVRARALMRYRLAGIAVAATVAATHTVPVAAVELPPETGTAGNPPVIEPPPPPPPSAPAPARVVPVTRPASRRVIRPAPQPQPEPTPTGVAVLPPPAPEPVAVQPVRSVPQPTATVPEPWHGAPLWLLLAVASLGLIGVAALRERLRWLTADGWSPAIPHWSWRSTFDRWMLRNWTPGT